ncbi:MAG: hypothetical protein HC800_25705 [Phormidesmis sp. RL_2_1]|nr:hypothetical protein [Phormidesmis sp. RL_2_1]
MRIALMHHLGTKFVPLPEEGKKVVVGICDRSACGRAVYDDSKRLLATDATDAKPIGL